MHVHESVQKVERRCCFAWSLSFSVESRGIWQLPSSLWHSPLPCAPGMLGCLHYWHTGQECGDERGLASGEETIWKHVHTSRLAPQQHCSLSRSVSSSPLRKIFFYARVTVPRKKRGPHSQLFFFSHRATLERKGKSKQRQLAITIIRKSQREEEEGGIVNQQAPTSW